MNSLHQFLLCFLKLHVKLVWSDYRSQDQPCKIHNLEKNVFYILNMIKQVENYSHIVTILQIIVFVKISKMRYEFGLL